MDNTEHVIQEIKREVSPATVEIKLDASRINYILLFHGSFNPPHIGHLDILKHSYQNLGKDVNMAFALLIPRSDACLRDTKFKGKEKPLILPHHKRGRLCYSDPRWSPWAAVLKDGNDKTSETCGNFQFEARRYGIRLSFMALRGVDTNPGLDWSGLSTSTCVSMILVNTYGQQGKDCLQSWNLGSEKWQALHDRGDEISIYQTALGSKKKPL